MRIPVALLSLTLTLLFALHAGAQAPPPANRPDPGVTPVRQIDRAEVRVTRVELDAGAIRSVHTHDDVRFHLFIPISGKLEITIGSAKPVEALPGQAYFMEKGTPHGFRNTGNSPAVVMEVFVKDVAATAQVAPEHEDALSRAQTLAAALALATLRSATAQPQPQPQR